MELQTFIEIKICLWNIYRHRSGTSGIKELSELIDNKLYSSCALEAIVSTSDNVLLSEKTSC